MAPAPARRSPLETLPHRRRPRVARQRHAPKPQPPLRQFPSNEIPLDSLAPRSPSLPPGPPVRTRARTSALIVAPPLGPSKPPTGPPVRHRVHEDGGSSPTPNPRARPDALPLRRGHTPVLPSSKSVHGRGNAPAARRDHSPPTCGPPAEPYKTRLVPTYLLRRRRKKEILTFRAFRP